VIQNDVVAWVTSALEAARVPYMLVGSFASSFHGAPRTTQDADIVVDATLDALLRVVDELGDDFYASAAAVREAHQQRRQFNVIHVESGFKVDLILRKHRPFSEAEFERRSGGSLAGREVPFATAEDTVLTKLEWARKADSERQYLDACVVADVQGTVFDWPYVERWASELGVGDLIERVRS
jgi:hypothetical protein